MSTRLLTMKPPKNYLRFIIICLAIISFFFMMTLSSDMEAFSFLDTAESNEGGLCIYQNKTYDLSYSVPNYEYIRGKNFSCRHIPTLKRLGLVDDENYIDFNQNEMPEPTFITAFSTNHAREATALIESIRKHWPDQKIVIYDLGLSEFYVEKIRKMCKVQYRHFKYDQYPPHVSLLNTYAWKPLIIAEAIKEFGAIWYADSSLTFTTNNLSHVYSLVQCRKNVGPNHKYFEQIKMAKSFKKNVNYTIESSFDKHQWKLNVEHCQKSAYLLHSFTGHGIVPATHGGVFRYLPSKMDLLKESTNKMHEAGFVFAVRTSDTVKDILKWYVLCALEKNCIAPRGASLYCSFGADKYSEESFRCHRFDQSVVNVLLANSNNYESRNYVSEIVNFFKVNRGQSKSWNDANFTCLSS